MAFPKKNGGEARGWLKHIGFWFIEMFGVKMLDLFTSKEKVRIAVTVRTKRCVVPPEQRTEVDELMDEELDSFKDSSTIVSVGGDLLTGGGLSSVGGDQGNQVIDGASCGSEVTTWTNNGDANIPRRRSLRIEMGKLRAPVDESVTTVAGDE